MNSDTSTYSHFLPLLFDRLDWKRLPSPSPDATDPVPALEAGRLDAAPIADHPQLPLGSDLMPDPFVGFGNLPFSSGILANHYPPDIQQQQHENVFRPVWAILPLNTLPGAASVKESVAGVMREARLLIQSGQSVEQVAGTKCNIAAIFDPVQFESSSLLTKWTAQFIYSMQHKHHDFVAYASMYLIWTLARWMIDPQPDTYEAIPDWLRPTMLQLWTPHVEVTDCVLWPGLRDQIIRHPQVLQKDWRWLEDICQSIDCEWFVDLDLALEVDLDTGESYLAEAAKVGFLATSRQAYGLMLTGVVSCVLHSYPIGQSDHLRDNISILSSR